MFNIFLKFVLYSILAFCISWGAVLLAGPKVLLFAISNKLGDNVQIHNLRINPKLSISISRVIFSNLQIFPDEVSDGSLRAITLDWSFSNSFIPKIKLSLGPLLFENNLIFNEAKIDLELPQMWNSNFLEFEFDAKNFSSADLIEVRDLHGHGSLDYQNLLLTDVTVSGSELALLGELELMAPTFSGSIKKLQFDKKNNLEFIEGFEVNANELQHKPLDYNLQTFSMQINFAKGLGNLGLNIMDIYDGEQDTLANNVKLSASSSSPDLLDWDGIKLKIDKVFLPDLPYYKEASSLKNFSVILKKDSRNEVEISSQGNFDSLELINQGTFLANLSGTRFNMEAGISTENHANDFLRSRVILKSNSQPVVALNGELKALFLEDRIDCLKNVDCFSEIWSNYKLEIDGNKLMGSSSCKSPNCYERGFEHIVESENTAMFFESALKSQIFNPIALSVFYTTLSSGQKNGNGHLVKF